MRSLSELARSTGEGIPLLHFANAFNTVDRNLMMSLTAKLCPELTNLTWWLYKLEPRLVTTRGDVVRSSTGVLFIKPPFRHHNAIHSRKVAERH